MLYINFKYVPGHSNDYYNEYADQLAKRSFAYGNYINTTKIFKHYAANFFVNGKLSFNLAKDIQQVILSRFFLSNNSSNPNCIHNGRFWNYKKFIEKDKVTILGIRNNGLILNYFDSTFYCSYCHQHSNHQHIFWECIKSKYKIKLLENRLSNIFNTNIHINLYPLDFKDRITFSISGAISFKNWYKLLKRVRFKKNYALFFLDNIAYAIQSLAIWNFQTSDWQIRNN